MRQLTIKIEHVAFKEELKRSAGKLKSPTPAELQSLPLTAYVLIGNKPKDEKKKDFGEGLAGTGFIIQNGKATHAIAVSASDARMGFMRIF